MADYSDRVQKLLELRRRQQRLKDVHGIINLREYAKAWSDLADAYKLIDAASNEAYCRMMAMRFGLCVVFTDCGIGNVMRVM